MQRKLYELPLISDICLDSICDICLNENYFLFFVTPTHKCCQRDTAKTEFYDLLLWLHFIACHLFDIIIASLHIYCAVLIFHKLKQSSRLWSSSDNFSPLDSLTSTFFTSTFFTLLTQGFIPWFHEYCRPDPATDVNWKLSERPDMIEFAEYTSGRAQHRLTIDKIDWPPNFSCTSVHNLHHILNATEIPCWQYKVVCLVA